MSNSIATPAPNEPNVRALLIKQQRETPDLLLPVLVRTPSLVLLWTLALGIVVAALALGRVRVPRTVSATVVVPATGPDSLTPMLLLPRAMRAFAAPGHVATVDTGDAGTITVSIVSAPVAAAQRSVPSRLERAGADSSTVAVRLERCHDNRCLPLTPGATYRATATLGTRSLASYTLTGS